MSAWICARPGCGHNRSQHAYELDRFRGVWVTMCKHVSPASGPNDRVRCGCPEFLEGAAKPQVAPESASAGWVLPDFNFGRA